MQDEQEVPLTMAQRRRRFVREVTGIVLGVVIALLLGAVATAIGWRIEAADARRALALELGEIIGQADERVLARDCLEQRFDAIAAVLQQAAGTGQLPPLGRIGDPPFRTWSSGVWDSTMNAEIASHMDRELLDNLSGAYEFVRIISAQTQVEDDAWTTLYAVVGPGRPIAPYEVAALRAALAKARMAHRKIMIGAVRTRQIADAYDLPYDRGTVAEYATTEMRDRYCAPLPPADGKPYGQAPFAGAYARMTANPIRRGASGLSASPAAGTRPGQ
jgi:hypothetical protein